MLCRKDIFLKKNKAPKEKKIVEPHEFSLLLLFNCTCFGEQEKLLEIAVPFSFPLQCLSREYEASVFAVKTSPPIHSYDFLFKGGARKSCIFTPFFRFGRKRAISPRKEKIYCLFLGSPIWLWGVRSEGFFFAKIHAHCSKHPKEKKDCGFF